jgi:hypothetical protein
MRKAIVGTICMVLMSDMAAAQGEAPQPVAAQPVPQSGAETPPAPDTQTTARDDHAAAVAKALAERTCPLPAIANSVPLEQVPGSSLVTVPMAINGDTKQFLLDIGARRLPEISPALRAALNLPQVFRMGENITPAPGTPFGGGLTDVIVRDVRNGPPGGDQEDIVRAGSLDVGRASGHHQVFHVGETWKFDHVPFAGSLTGDFFRNYDVELDFGDKQVTWLTPTRCTDPHQVVFWAHTNVAVIPVSLAKDGRFQMQATVRGHTINVELDTSSEHSVMRRDIAESDVGLKSEPPDMIPDGDSRDGRHMQIYLHTFPELIFAGGSIVALNVPVRIQDYSLRPARFRQMGTGNRADMERIPDLVMGMDLLKFLHLYIVPGQGMLYVTAAHEELSPQD